jgi:hypothetical protein
MRSWGVRLFLKHQSELLTARCSHVIGVTGICARRGGIANATHGFRTLEQQLLMLNRLTFSGRWGVS